MKHITFTLRAIILSFTLLATVSSVKGQCFADYNTYNNFCYLDSLFLEAVPIGGTGPYTFLWETGDTTQIITIPLANGDYMVTITDANGCTVTINCHIKPSPLVLYYPFNQNACEGDTVTLFLEWFRDSIPGATYLWSTGDTTSTIQITDDLLWSATVTDPNTGCEFVIEPNFFDFHPTPYPEIVGPQMLCAGQSITLTVEGGPFGNILWYEAGSFNGIDSDSLVITQPGTWIVWGSSTEVNYCWHQDTITIVPGDINPPELAGPPMLCNGQSGDITITNAIQYSSFLWSNGETTSTITVNNPGTYTVTVTNAGGCTATGSYTVADGTSFETASSATPSTCGESNGSIDLSVDPPGTYTFQWTNGSTTEDLADVTAGTYVVTVTSSNGCTLTDTVIVADNPIPITITGTTIPHTSCITDNGAIDITLDPPGSYTYLWSNGATSEDLGALGGGTYTVTVTLGVNCTATGQYIVEELLDAPQITALEIPATCGQSNGGIDLSVSGSEPPYTFLWSTGDTSEDLMDIPGDLYSVTITGANGCSESLEIIIPDNELDFIITGDVVPVTSCSEENGSIDLSVTPDTLYTFLWSNGATTEDLFNLEEGIYTVEVLFGETCMETATFTVVHEGAQIDVSGVAVSNNSCTVPNGMIDITVQPAGEYTFLWSNGAMSEDLSGLAPGIYTVTITDGNDCSTFGTFTVNDETSDPLLSAEIMPATCGQVNGAIDVSVSPPSGNTFSWSNGMTSEDLTGVEPGTYTVTVSAANGCVTIDTFQVSNEIADITLSAIPTDNTSCTDPNGTLDLTVAPPGGYTFQWSNGAITEDLGQLPAGTYVVTVTDTNGCATTSVFEIGSSVSSPMITATTIPATCGQENGGITLEVMPGDTYTYVWSNGATTGSLTNLQPGVYSVTVTASNGCSASDTLVIENINTSFTVDALIRPDSSCTDHNGEIDLILFPPGAYSFTWSNGLSTEDIGALLAGSYAVTITDTLGCSSSDTFLIADHTEIPVLEAILSAATCGQENGMIDLQVNPQGTYSFLWSNGMLTSHLADLPAGTYEVTVTNQTGCTATGTYEIENIQTHLSLSASLTANTSCTETNGGIDLSVSPPGTYVFEWSNGSDTEDIHALDAGVYSITITDTLGCTASDTFTINDEATEPVLTAVVIPAVCGQQDGSIDLTVTPSGVHVYSWSNGSAEEDLSDLTAGTYHVTVTDANGCTAEASFDVNGTTAQFTLALTTSANTSCVAPNGNIDLMISPPGDYLITWDNGSHTEDLSALIAGMYSVTVSDSADCPLTDSILVTDEIVYPEVNPTVIPATCGEDNGLIALSITPSSGSTILWSNGASAPTLVALAPGMYSVTVTNAEGCTWSDQITLAGTEALTTDLGADLSVAYGQETTLQVEVNVPVDALDTVIWTPAHLFSCTDPICLDQTITPLEQTRITVMVFDTNGCMAEDELILNVISDPSVFIPNVFSPNGDGTNDVFTVFGNSDIEEITDLRIFDRWGEFVFQRQHFPPNQFDYGWDGNYRGQLLNPQVLVYWALVRFTDGSEELYKGDVTLVR